MMRLRSLKIVSNHHGWSLWGIRTWISGGWCIFCRWGREPGFSLPIAQTCRKIGLVAWCMDDYERHARWINKRPWLKGTRY